MGAYTASASPYGTFDQSGDVFQWNETQIGSFRGLRGGSWGSSSFDMSSSYRYDINPSVEDHDNAVVGFRVAIVPEPSTAVLAGIACGLMIALRRRRK